MKKIKSDDVELEKKIFIIIYQKVGRKMNFRL